MDRNQWFSLQWNAWSSFLRNGWPILQRNRWPDRSGIRIELNNAYQINPDDLSDIDDGSFFGRLKRIVFYGSKKRIVAQRKRHHREWVEPKKFVIGDDGGEEIFYIYLNKPQCPVYAYELETGNSFYRFDLISKYTNDIDALEEM